MRPIQYKVVSEWDIVDIQQQVNLKIKEGWHPLGGISINEEGLKYQAIIKYETEKSTQKLPNIRPISEMKSYVPAAKHYCELMGYGDGSSLTPERRADILDDLERLDFMMQALRKETD